MVLGQIAAQLGDGGLDANIDPPQRGVVGKRPGIVDDRVDQLARGLRLVLALAIRFLEVAKARRLGLLVRR